MGSAQDVLTGGAAECGGDYRGENTTKSSMFHLSQFGSFMFSLKKGPFHIRWQDSVRS